MYSLTALIRLTKTDYSASPIKSSGNPAPFSQTLIVEDPLIEFNGCFIVALKTAAEALQSVLLWKCTALNWVG